MFSLGYRPLIRFTLLGSALLSAGSVYASPKLATQNCSPAVQLDFDSVSDPFVFFHPIFQETVVYYSDDTNGSGSSADISAVRLGRDGRPGTADDQHIALTRSSPTGVHKRNPVTDGAHLAWVELQSSPSSAHIVLIDLGADGIPGTSDDSPPRVVDSLPLLSITRVPQISLREGVLSWTVMNPATSRGCDTRRGAALPGHCSQGNFYQMALNYSPLDPIAMRVPFMGQEFPVSLMQALQFSFPPQYLPAVHIFQANSIIQPSAVQANGIVGPFLNELFIHNYQVPVAGGLEIRSELRSLLDPQMRTAIPRPPQIPARFYLSRTSNSFAFTGLSVLYTDPYETTLFDVLGRNNPASLDRSFLQGIDSIADESLDGGIVASALIPANRGLWVQHCP